ncbi:MAG: apolipoprotein N-acyltransferase [Alkalispirochaeta sp.]
MRWNTEYPRDLLPPIVLLAASLTGTVVTFLPAHSILPIGLGDGTLLSLIALHFVWALHLGSDALRDIPTSRSQMLRAAEALFFFGLFLFLFAYVYAANANMDYVQRFVAGGGTIQLAPDTRTERILVAGRYGPFLLADLYIWIRAVSGGRHTPGVRHSTGIERVAPAVMLVSVVISALAYPSFLNVDGIAVLGWFGMVPLFALIRSLVSRGRAIRAVWYGVLYGVLFTLIGNYWLGTFNLISLQAVGVIFFGFYLLYMPVAVGSLVLVDRALRRSDGAVHRVLIGARALVLPLSWTFFELARSSGFLGYPWLLAAHSQYRNPVVIQGARFGGVWLVSFVVLLVNALLAEGILHRFDKMHHRRVRRRGRRYVWRSGIPWMLAAVTVFGVNVLYGTIVLSDTPSEDTVRIALIQQNSDPRKHDYRRTFNSLKRLTDEALAYDPDLVAWSETAFVPNIRRWSDEDPRLYSLAQLVQEFNEYLDSVDAWLLTGNDDYRRVLDDSGTEIERHNYNAAVLFSDAGERRETYHKIKLVPFTEHFPYREQLPWVYDLLMSVDITFWTPGEEYTIFHHPEFAFATPICFEDVFPGVVRRFALEGMEVIVNLTNDYWSLREQAAQQHFAAALFRTVELGMPMVRATASGVTSHIDRQGRIVAMVPQYSEQYLIADVSVDRRDAVGQGRSGATGGDASTGGRAAGSVNGTRYLRWGDWFPFTTFAMWGVIVVAATVKTIRYRFTGMNEHNR